MKRMVDIYIEKTMQELKDAYDYEEAKAAEEEEGWNPYEDPKTLAYMVDKNPIHFICSPDGHGNLEYDGVRLTLRESEPWVGIDTTDYTVEAAWEKSIGYGQIPFHIADWIDGCASAMFGNRRTI